MNDLARQLAHSTVRLECDVPGAGPHVGTGFFYHFFVEGEDSVPTIVTNRHVVEGATIARIRMHLSHQPGELPEAHKGIELRNFQKLYMLHPDPTVDLAVIGIFSLVKQIRALGREPYHVRFSAAHLLTDAEWRDIPPLEDVAMIGYPNGLWDEAHNMPLFRRGVTASIPAHDFNGKREFLVDMACFPGSSGSPVVIINDRPYFSGTQQLVVGDRLKLLGILRAGPQYEATGEVVMRDVAEHERPVVISKLLMNIGYVIKADLLRDFEESIRAEIGAG